MELIRTGSPPIGQQEQRTVSAGFLRVYAFFLVRCSVPSDRHGAAAGVTLSVTSDQIGPIPIFNAGFSRHLKVVRGGWRRRNLKPPLRPWGLAGAPGRFSLTHLA